MFTNSVSKYKSGSLAIEGPYKFMAVAVSGAAELHVLLREAHWRPI